MNEQGRISEYIRSGEYLLAAVCLCLFALSYCFYLKLDFITTTLMEKGRIRPSEN